MKTLIIALKRLFVCSLLLSLAPLAIAQGNGGFRDIYFFGDSLSDSGNVYALTGQTAKAPYFVIPSLPYAIGGHHFSNGKTWAERFAQNMQSNNSGKAALDSPGKNGNYAFGGARARSNSGSTSPDSSIQVGMYLGDFGSADPSALYVIQFGGNDLRDALVAAASDPNVAVAIILDAVQSTSTAIEALHDAGARHFMIATAPNLEHAPAVKLSGASAAAAFFAGLYNGILDGALQQAGMLEGITIYKLDLAAFLNDVVAGPGDFGLTETNAPCLMFFTESDAKCDNPEDHLFWDGIHPTAAAHDELADVATSLINGN